MNRLVLVFVLLLAGCIPISPLPNYYEGSSPTKLANSAETQIDVIDSISKSAKITKTNATDAIIVEAEQDKIITNIDRLRDVTETLINESRSKKSWLAERSELYTELVAKTKLITTLQQADEEAFKKQRAALAQVMLWFMIVGGLCIPVGIFLAFKFDPQFIWLVVGGVILIVSGNMVTWIQDNWQWFAYGIIVAFAGMTYRMYSTHKRVVKATVKTTEQLKAEIKNLPVGADPKQALVKIFGDEHTTGEAGLQDNITKRAVKSVRKELRKEWAPI